MTLEEFAKAMIQLLCEESDFCFVDPVGEQQGYEIMYERLLTKINENPKRWRRIYYQGHCRRHRLHWKRKFPDMREELRKPKDNGRK